MPTQAEAIEALRRAQYPVDPAYAPPPAYDPMQAVRMFGSALGVNDAIRALRGEMTPEEQQQFAVTAALGLVPGAEGLGEAVGPAVKAAEKAVPELASSLSQKEIEKALAKNPGASIFDIANPEGPSSSYSYKGQPETVFKMPASSFPQEVPFGVPKQAQPLGFSQPAVHGTATPLEYWVTPKGTNPAEEDALKLPEDELGVHFGNPRQAKEFAGNFISTQRDPRTYPVVLQANNPVTLPDTGTWHVEDVLKGLRTMNNDRYSVMGKRLPNPHVGQFPDDELSGIKTIGDVRGYLTNKGFDSVRYINRVEDKGQPSYIMFKPSAENPDYVGGVRSPFAKFDPAKLGSPALAAGIGGAAAISPQISEYIKALGAPQDQQ
jgi:hypothetical protein